MEKKILRFEIDGMPCQSGDPVGVYIRKHSDVCGYPHIHDCYELEMISFGECKEVINSVSYLSKRGDAFLLTPNDFHRLENLNNVEIYNIMFREEVIHKYYFQTLCDMNLNQNIFCHFDEDEYRYLLTLLDYAIKEYCERSRFFEKILADTINIMIAMMLRKCHIHISKEVKDHAIRKAMIYLQFNCQENPSLEKVAKHIGLNPTYFSDKFHRDVGVTFKTYLTELKLNRARQSLLMTNLSIAEVCFSSGFPSLPAFFREFKKKFGVTPQSIRRDGIKSDK